MLGGAGGTPLSFDPIFYSAASLVTSIDPPVSGPLFPLGPVSLHGLFLTKFYYSCIVTDKTSGLVISASDFVSGATATDYVCLLSDDAAETEYEFGQEVLLTILQSTGDGDPGDIVVSVNTTLSLGGEPSGDFLPFSVADGVLSASPPPGTTFVRSLSVGPQPIFLSGLFADSALVQNGGVYVYNCTLTDEQGHVKTGFSSPTSTSQLVCQFPLSPILFPPSDIVTLTVTNVNTSRVLPLSQPVQYMSRAFVTEIAGSQGNFVFPGFTTITAKGNFGNQCYVMYLYALNQNGLYDPLAAPLCKSPPMFGQAKWSIPSSCTLPSNIDITFSVRYIPSLLNTPESCSSGNQPDPLFVLGGNPVFISGDSTPPRPSSSSCFTTITTNPYRSTLSFSFLPFLTTSYPIVSYAWSVSLVNQEASSESVQVAAETLNASQDPVTVKDIGLGDCPYSACTISVSLTATNAHGVFATCSQTVYPKTAVQYVSNYEALSLTSLSPQGDFSLTLSAPAGTFPQNTGSLSIQSFTSIPPSVPPSVPVPFLGSSGRPGRFIGVAFQVSLFDISNKIMMTAFQDGFHPVTFAVDLSRIQFSSEIVPQESKLMIYNPTMQAFQDASSARCASPFNDFDGDAKRLVATVCQLSATFAVFAPLAPLTTPTPPSASSTVFAMDRTLLIEITVPIGIVIAALVTYFYGKRLKQDDEEEVYGNLEEEGDIEMNDVEREENGLMGGGPMSDEYSREDDEIVGTTSGEPRLGRSAKRQKRPQRHVTQIIEEVIEEYVDNDEDVGEEVLYEEVILDEDQAELYMQQVSGANVRRRSGSI